MAYNRTMRKNSFRTAMKILLPFACILWLGFIFGNSLRTGDRSSEQSSSVVGIVQAIARVVAPRSFAATAVGEDYDVLHSLVRTLAHFTEFAGLGGLLCWCHFAYTDKARYLYLPLLFALLMPCVDECLQLYTAERAGTLEDILVDCSGLIVGFIAAFIALAIGKAVVKRSKKSVPCTR